MSVLLDHLAWAVRYTFGVVAGFAIGMTVALTTLWVASLIVRA